MRKITVVLQIPDSADSADEWLRQFLGSARPAPKGVVVTVEDTIELGRPLPPGEYIGYTAFMQLLKARVPARNLRYDTRMVLYAFVQLLHDKLDVRCTYCRRRYGACRCETREYTEAPDGTWRYNPNNFEPGSSICRFFWAISVESLAALTESDVARVNNGYNQRRCHLMHYIVQQMQR